jgi:hypothetical protein
VTAADQPTTEPSGWPEFVETITTGNPPVELVACTLCGVLLWDAEKHQAHAHPAPQPAADTERPVDVTPRGFGIWSEFTDRYGQKVTVVESSLATEACVWVAPADGQNIHLNEPQATELRNALSAWLLALDETQETNA